VVTRIFPHLAYRTAPTAFVNCELVRVTAPITGRLSPDLPHRGEIIDRRTLNLVEALSSEHGGASALCKQRTIAKMQASYGVDCIPACILFARNT
jgi:hypothetical protein